MRFFLAVAINVSAYGQQSKEDQLAALLAQAAARLAEIEAERESEADAQPAVSQQCTLNNVRACSTEQLCARGTIGLPKQWRTNGSRLPYADEAKRKGLTCGVGVGTSTASPQSSNLSTSSSSSFASSSSSSDQSAPTNTRACTISQLCDRATSGYPKRWLDNSYAERAEARMLDCDVPDEPDEPRGLFGNMFRSGTSYTTSGDTLRLDDGTRYRTSGDTIWGSDVTSYRTSGGNLWGSDGTHYRRSGDTVWTSDGTMCRQIGSAMRCL